MGDSKILNFDPTTADDTSLFDKARSPSDPSFLFLFLSPLSQTFRIVAVNASSIMSNYMSDELSQDITRDELVSRGKMTQADADKERQQWTEVR
jgi:hypothetical protein